MATLTAIFNAQDNLSKAMANAGNAGTKTSGIMQKLGKIGSVAMKGIVTAVVAAGTALVAFGKKAINVGMAYESSMSQVMATMGLDKSTEAGAKAYETLAAAAEHMGATTAFSTTEAADALNYLALAGYDAEKAAAALPTVLYLAGAGAMDLASASDMLTDAMSALQIEATQDNLTEFSDKLAKTASSSNTSVAQLGEAVLAVGGTAANLKGGITELTASLGILADAGIKGSEAGTHLRNMINSLQKGRNGEATTLMKKMGFSAYDAAGNMRSLGDQFKDINAYMEGMSGAEVDSVIRTLFKQTDLAAARAMLAATSNSVESLANIVNSSLSDSGKSLSDYGIDLSELAKTFDPLMTQEQFAANMMQQFGLDAETAGMIFEGLNSVLGGTGTRFDELTKKIDDSAGACEKMYRTMLDNLKGDVSIFNSTVEALYIEIFKSANGTLRDLVQTGTSYMQRLIDAFKVGGFSGLASELGNVLGDAVSVVMSYAPKIISAATEVISSLVDSFGNNADTIAEAAVNIALQLGSAILKIAPKLGSAFVKVVGSAGKALIGAIPKLFKAVPDKFYNAIGLDKKKVVKSVRRFATGLKKTFTSLFKGDFLGAVDGIGTIFKINPRTISNIKSALSNVGNWTKSTFSDMKTAFSAGYAEGGLFGGIKSAFTSLKSSIANIDWSGIWDGIKNTASNVYENLKTAATDAKDKIVSWFQSINWTGIWNTITNTATDLWNRMKLAAVLAWLRVRIWFRSVDWSGIWNKITSTASELLEKMKTAASNAKGRIISWFQRIDWSGIWNKIVSTGTSLGEKLKSAAITAKNTVISWFQSVNWQSIWNRIVSTGASLGEKLKSAATTAKNAVISWFQSVNWQNIWAAVSRTASSLLSKMKSAASSAFTSVKSWFMSRNWNDIWAKVKNTGNTLWTKMKSALTTAVTNAKTYFTTIDWSAIWDKITDTKDTLVSKIKELLGKIPEAISNLASDAANFINSGTFASLGESIINFISAAIKAKSGGTAAKIIDAITGLFQGVDFSNLGAELSSAASNLGDMLMKMIVASIDGVKTGGSQLINAVSRLLETVLSPANVSGFAGTLAGFGTKLISLISKALSTAVESIGSAAADLSGPISTIINGLFTALTTAFSPENIKSVGDSINQFASSVYKAIGDALGGALEAVGSLDGAAIGSGAGEIVSNILSTIFSGISDLSSDANITGFVDSLGQGISSAMETLGEVVGSFAGKLVQWLFSGEAVSQIFEAGANIINLLIKGIGYGIEGIANFTMGILDGILESLGLLDPDQKAAYEAALQTGQVYKEAINQAFTEVMSDPNFNTDPDKFNQALTQALFGDFRGFDPASKEKFLRSLNVDWISEDMDLSVMEANFGAVVDNMWSRLNDTVNQKRELSFDGEVEFSGAEVKEIMGPVLEGLGASADILSDEMYNAIATKLASGGIEQSNDLMSLLFGNLVQTATEGGNQVQAASEAAAQAAQELGIATTELGNANTGMFAELDSGAQAAATAAVDSMNQIASQVDGSAITTAVAEDITAGASTVEAAVTGIGEEAKATAASVDMTAEGTTAMGTFANGMTATQAEVISVASSIGTDVRGTMSAVSLTAEGSNMMRTLTAGMNSGRGAVIASARTTGTGIKSAFASVNLYSTGANVMRGMLNGMNSMFSTLLSRAKQMAAQLKQTIQSGMQVASPSKFTTWVGEMTGQGLVDGLESMTGKAVDAASNMVSGVSGAFTPSVASAPTATASPYEMLSGNSGGEASQSGGERHIVIDVKGGGRIEVTGLTKEKAIELITEQIKPQLQNILAEEIFTGGTGVYEY